MPANAFIGKAEPPGDGDLAGELGALKPLWDVLLRDLEHECGVPVREWHSYSKKAGWSLRLKRGTRTVVYLVPQRESFEAAFALGDRAVAAARTSGLPAAVLRIIETAKRYVEGTAVRIQVNGPADVAVVKTLATLKLAN